MATNTITNTVEAVDLLKVISNQLDAGQRGMAIHNLVVVKRYIDSIPGLKTQVEWKMVRKHAALLKRYES